MRKASKAWHQHACRWRGAEQPTHNHAACTRAQAQDDATRACLAAACVCPISPEVRQWRSTFFLGVAGLRISSPHPAQAQRSKTARATRARTSIYPATRTWCAASWSCAHSRGNRSNWPYRGLSRSPRWPATQAGSTQRTPAGWRSRSRQLFQMEGACTCTSRTQAAKKRWPCPLLRVAAAQ